MEKGWRWDRVKKKLGLSKDGVWRWNRVKKLGLSKDGERMKMR